MGSFLALRTPNSMGLISMSGELGRLDSRLEILRVRLYVDLDVSEDEHLRSGELVRGVSGTSLAVWTESPSLSLLLLAISQGGVWAGKGPRISTSSSLDWQQLDS